MIVSCHLKLEEISLPPGQEWVDEAAAWRFVRISSGAAYWLDPAQPRGLVEGLVLVLAPCVKAVVRASQLNTLVFHVFNFDPDLLCGFFTLVERQYFSGPLRAALGEVQFLPSTHPAAQRFTRSVLDEPARFGLTHRVELLGIAAVVFATAMTEAPVARVRSTSALLRFDELIAQLPELELLTYTVQQLADLCRCSPRQFSRLFRARFATSARARQTELRLLRARQLLSSTRDEVRQIAFGCGYRNLSLFTSLFKRRFGLTPSEWRQEYSKSAKDGIVLARPGPS